jgi:hypothetical protein
MAAMPTAVPTPRGDSTCRRSLAISNASIAWLRHRLRDPLSRATVPSHTNDSATAGWSGPRTLRWISSASWSSSAAPSSCPCSRRVSPRFAVVDATAGWSGPRTSRYVVSCLRSCSARSIRSFSESRKACAPASILIKRCLRSAAGTSQTETACESQAARYKPSGENPIDRTTPQCGKSATRRLSLTCHIRTRLSSPQLARRLRDPDRQKVVYAAAAPVVVMPRSWNRVCMLMRRFS